MVVRTEWKIVGRVLGHHKPSKIPSSVQLVLQENTENRDERKQLFNGYPFDCEFFCSGTIRVWELDLPNRKIWPTECQTGQMKRIAMSITVSITLSVIVSNDISTRS